MKKCRGRETDERKIEDIEVSKKIKQKEDRKEERKAERKAEKDKDDASQGECLDTSRKWICPDAKQKMQSHMSFVWNVMVAVPTEALNNLLQEAANHQLTGEGKTRKRRIAIGRGKPK